MDGEKIRVPEHHFKQDLMIGVAAALLLLIFFLNKKFNNSKIFGGALTSLPAMLRKALRAG